jgi:hypothetical protein
MGLSVTIVYPLPVILEFGFLREDYLLRKSSHKSERNTFPSRCANHNIEILEI